MHCSTVPIVCLSVLPEISQTKNVTPFFFHQNGELCLVSCTNFFKICYDVWFKIQQYPWNFSNISQILECMARRTDLGGL